MRLRGASTGGGKSNLGLDRRKQCLREFHLKEFSQFLGTKQMPIRFMCILVSISTPLTQEMSIIVLVGWPFMSDFMTPKLFQVLGLFKKFLCVQYNNILSVLVLSCLILF